jgi:hypothetical protein
MIRVVETWVVIISSISGCFLTYISAHRIFLVMPTKDLNDADYNVVIKLENCMLEANGVQHLKTDAGY